MAFEHPIGRYASFGVVTSLPGEVIDSIWYVIDHYLKGVVPLRHLLRFRLKNRKGKLTLVFSQEGFRNSLAVYFPYSFDPFYPATLLVIDSKGKETISLPDEVGLL